MTTVKCSEWTCRDCKDGICERDDVELESMECLDYVAWVDVAPEYQNTYYRQLKSREDEHLCRQESRGKRYEFFGMVFYTSQDDRSGIEDLEFTEEVSGYRIRGRDIMKEEMAQKIREKVAQAVPVATLPEAAMKDLW